MTRPLALLASTLLLLSAQSPQLPLAGFSPDTARRQFALEKDFDAKLVDICSSGWTS